jgi:hypothetical protein
MKPFDELKEALQKFFATQPHLDVAALVFAWGEGAEEGLPNFLAVTQAGEMTEPAHLLALLQASCQMTAELTAGASEIGDSVAQLLQNAVEHTAGHKTGTVNVGSTSDPR